MLSFDLITIFPEFFNGPLDYGIIRRARQRNLIRTEVHDLRGFTHDRHRMVDDRPFGGGEGMVLKPEPLFEAVDSIRTTGSDCEVIVLSASGRLFDQAQALRLSRKKQIILICGRYEGIDERVTEHLADSELSIGNFIVSGGEIAAALVVDAVTRYVPGAVGKDESVLRDSFSDPAESFGKLEHPHYTRPARFRDYDVPEVLLSGDHEAIARWRREESIKKTARNRPELVEDADTGDDDPGLLEGTREQ